MRLYFFSSASHHVLKDEWFLPSLKDDFELVYEEAEQACKNGEFMAAGWLETMLGKVDLILRAIRENPGEVFLHSDVDVQFFQPIQSDIEGLMQGKDFVIMRDSPRGVMCPGFFAGRGTDRLLDLWSRIRDAILPPGKKHDQDLLNDFVLGEVNPLRVAVSRIIYRATGAYIPVGHRPPARPCTVRWDYLPERYYCYGAKTWREWRPGTDLQLPSNIMLHHANWTRGIDNKIAQMKAARAKVGE